MNIACIFESVRKASVEVMTDCFARAAEIGAAVASTRAILPGHKKESRLTASLKNPWPSLSKRRT